MRRSGSPEVASDSDVVLSARVALAQLAEGVIARTDGVSPTTGPAGRWRTVGAPRAIHGVLAVEDARGRVDLELHLVVRWPPQMPLEQLGDLVRGRLRSAAGTAGMGARLGAVAVAFDDLLIETESA
jgi:hypothetical protein